MSGDVCFSNKSSLRWLIECCCEICNLETFAKRFWFWFLMTPTEGERQNEEFIDIQIECLCLMIVDFSFIQRDIIHNSFLLFSFVRSAIRFGNHTDEW